MRLKAHHYVGALLTAALVVLVIVLSAGPVKNYVTYKLHGPGQKVLTLPKPAEKIAESQQKEAAAGNTEASHSHLRQESPTVNTPAAIQHDQALKPAGQPTVPAHLPLATVNQQGCRTLLVRNFSPRNGRPILLGVLHQTISADAGWNGVLGNVRWFDTSAAQASSNYIVARSGGQCAYTVPETTKAWAQASYNSVSLSIEVTETGREGSYLPPGPGRAKTILLMIAWHHRWHLPYRHGAVDNATCTVVKPGFVEHADLGTCGGGHHDDQPYSIDSLIREAALTDHVALKPTKAQKLAALKVQQAAARKRIHQLGCGVPAKRKRHPHACSAAFAKNKALHTAIKRASR